MRRSEYAREITAADILDQRKKWPSVGDVFARITQLYFQSLKKNEWPPDWRGDDMLSLMDRVLNLGMDITAIRELHRLFHGNDGSIASVRFVAKSLGLSRHTVYKRMHMYGISVRLMENTHLCADDLVRSSPPILRNIAAIIRAFRRIHLIEDSQGNSSTSSCMFPCQDSLSSPLP